VEETMRNAFGLLATMVLGLALLPCRAFAQQSDVDAVKGANATYLAAIGSLDIKKMEPLWAHESYVTLIAPGDRSISVGWDAVKKNWEDGPFRNDAELKVTAVDGPHIHVNGNVAWATGINHADGKMKNGNSFSGDTFNTQVYEKQGDRWLLVSNSAVFVPK
jgi:ketosteroid isomerase-like protein